MRASYVEHMLKDHGRVKLNYCHQGFFAEAEFIGGETVSGRMRDTVEDAIESLDEELCSDWAKETEC